MLGIPPSDHAPTAAQRSGDSPKGTYRVRVWPLILSALGMIAIAAVFGASGVLVDLLALVLGLVLLGTSLVRPHGTSLRAGILVFLLVALLATGILKVAWLVNNLPSPNGHSSPLPYVFVAAIAPVAVGITALSVRRSPLSLTNKVIRVSTVGLLVGFLPWLILMMTGIAD
jgi:hypothetical protein